MCTLLVFFYPSECNGTTTTNTTTTTVTLTSTPNCNLSISGITYDNSLATQLTPGKVYEIVFVCLNCTKNVTMSKSVYFVESLLFQILTMSTTMTLYVFPVLYIKCIVLPIFSSLSLKSRFLFFLNYTRPEGNSSFYGVQKSNGTLVVIVTQTTITKLTAGVHYDINVIAVPADNFPYLLSLP